VNAARRTLIAVTVALAAAGTACSSPSRAPAGTTGNVAGAYAKPAAVAAHGGGPTVIPARNGSQVAGPFGSPFATKSAVAHDSPSDAQAKGDAPSYAEITSGAVQGLGEQLTLTLVMAGALPAKMPDTSTTMIVSWNLSGDRHHKTMGFSAQAGDEGWTVSAGGNDGTVPYPGTFSVSGNRISLTFPWSFVGGARKFQWSASSSWFANANAAYSVDNIPNARFPAKKG